MPVSAWLPVRKINGGLFSGVPFVIVPADLIDGGKSEASEPLLVLLVLVGVLLLLLVDPQAAAATTTDARTTSVASRRGSRRTRRRSARSIVGLITAVPPLIGAFPRA